MAPDSDGAVAACRDADGKMKLWKAFSVATGAVQYTSEPGGACARARQGRDVVEFMLAFFDVYPFDDSPFADCEWGTVLAWGDRVIGVDSSSTSNGDGPPKQPPGRRGSFFDRFLGRQEEDEPSPMMPRNGQLMSVSLSGAGEAPKVDKRRPSLLPSFARR